MVKKVKDDSKVILKNGIENPKKKNQKMEKVKKAVKAGLIETPEPVAEFDELDLNNKGSKKSKSKNKVSEEPKVESDEETPDEIKVDGEEEEESVEAVGYTLLVQSLAPETKREEIIKLFKPYGKVLSVLFSSPRGISYKPVLGTQVKAFVVLDSLKAASKAVEVNGSLVNGRKVKVLKCKPAFVSDSTNTIFVKNISTNDLKKIKDFFSSCGSVRYVKFLKDSAFVYFNDTKSVESAFKLDGSMLDDRPIKVAKYDPQYKLIPTDKKALENISPEELKDKMVKLGQKYSKLMKNNSSAPYNSKFNRVQGPKIHKGPRKFVRREE